MKIGIVLENPIQVGGGFNQGLNAIRQLSRICAGQHTVAVYTSIAANLEQMQQFQVDVKCLTTEGVIHLAHRLVRAAMRRLGLGKFMQAHDARRMEKILQAEGVDLAYFVTHSSTPAYFRRLNYMTTVLDLCHRDNLEFPEVSAGGQFEERERHFTNCLPRAYVVIAASTGLVNSIVSRYGIDADRIIAMPFEPSPYLTHAGASSTKTVLERYGLQPGYYFYPAQFWPHKNHFRLIEALALLKQRNTPESDMRLVLSGGDQGNMGWIKREAVRLGVSDLIHFLGFVPAEDIRGLYEGALAVVMPTYFGPTNMPPLEAWAMKRPLVYSAHLGEQIGDAALMADADDASAWAEAMLRVRDPEVTRALIQKGLDRLKMVEAERMQAEIELSRKLERFVQRRQCWE